MFISRGKKGGNSGGDIGRKKEEMTAEGMLKGKIAQQIAEIEEQICSFLRNGKCGFFSQQLAGAINVGNKILLCNCLNSGISPKGL